MPVLMSDDRITRIPAIEVGEALVDLYTCGISAEGRQLACFFDATNISREARTNRALLADVLTAAGLVNYPTEWWHWSYGDRYWAFTEHRDHALYGPIEAPVLSHRS